MSLSVASCSAELSIHDHSQTVSKTEITHAVSPTRRSLVFSLFKFILIR